MEKNKKILIFGASGLLGAELVENLLSKKFNIVAVDKNISNIEKIGKKMGACENLIPVQKNISATTDLKDIFSQHQDFDGLVNCLYLKNKNYGSKFLKVKNLDFNENINLNLGTAFQLLKYSAKSFLDSRRKISIVFFSSIYGTINPKFNLYNGTGMTMPVEYACYKSSVNHLCRYVVKYINSSSFRVNTVSPGGIYDNQDKKFCDEYKKYTLGKGMLSKKDCSELTAFLLSEKSMYINGQDIKIDDGFSL